MANGTPGKRRMNRPNDIVIFCSVSQNEMSKIQSWLLPSLSLQRYNGRVRLYLINYTGEKRQIYFGKKEYDNITIEEIFCPKPYGFGAAHNHAFQIIQPEHQFIIVNPDVFLHEDCIRTLIQRKKEITHAGIIEARQLPFEHPKEFNQTSGETPWASGFCILIDSSFFQDAGGFDEMFWMYVEDVDLSWRSWLMGYPVLHEPRAVAYHYTGAHFSYCVTSYYIEHLWSARNFIYLLYKYWGARGEMKAISLLKKAGYDPAIENAILQSYFEVKKSTDDTFRKKNQKAIRKTKMIKVTGFNTFHSLRY